MREWTLCIFACVVVSCSERECGHSQGFTIIGPPLHYWYSSLGKVAVGGLTGVPLYLLSASKSLDLHEMDTVRVSDTPANSAILLVPYCCHCRDIRQDGPGSAFVGTHLPDQHYCRAVHDGGEMCCLRTRQLPVDPLVSPHTISLALVCRI